MFQWVDVAVCDWVTHGEAFLGKMRHPGGRGPEIPREMRNEAKFG